MELLRIFIGLVSIMEFFLAFQSFNGKKVFIYFLTDTITAQRETLLLVLIEAIVRGLTAVYINESGIYYANLGLNLCHIVFCMTEAIQSHKVHNKAVDSTTVRLID